MQRAGLETVLAEPLNGTADGAPDERDATGELVIGRAPLDQGVGDRVVGGKPRGRGADLALARRGRAGELVSARALAPSGNERGEHARDARGDLRAALRHPLARAEETDEADLDIVEAERLETGAADRERAREA